MLTKHCNVLGPKIGAEPLPIPCNAAHIVESDSDNAARYPVDEIDQPLDAFCVQMVCGLIKQQ